MKLEIDLSKCASYGITPNHIVLLYLMKHNDFDRITKIFTKGDALKMRGELLEGGFLKSDGTGKFMGTLINKPKYNHIFNIKDLDIKFWDWYSLYPVRFDGRVFRAAKEDSELAKKHKKKYLKRINSVKQHELAITATKAFLASKNNDYRYLPQMEKVVNNSMWESWESLIERHREDNWQSDEI